MQTHLQPFQSFIDKSVSVLQHDPEAVGLAAGGSWASGGVDAYSDLDLVLVSNRRIAPDLDLMRTYADQFGDVLVSFRGDHVGESRLLIALYDKPLLHVDIKFLTPPEFCQRVEDPVILWERDHGLTEILEKSTAHYPAFDFQWMEDRFWVWMHYALLKIGRGEFVEALDFLAFIRGTVLGPMLHLRYGGLPRGVRRIETVADTADLARLHQTIASPNPASLLDSLKAAMQFYVDLRATLAPATLQRRDAANRAVEAYLLVIESATKP